jgi:hypothetical protein
MQLAASVSNGILCLLSALKLEKSKVASWATPTPTAGLIGTCGFKDLLTFKEQHAKML